MERKTYPCELKWQIDGGGLAGRGVRISTLHLEKDFSILLTLAAWLGSFALVVFWAHQVTLLGTGQFPPGFPMLLGLVSIPLVWWCWRQSSRALPHGVRINVEEGGLSWERYHMGVRAESQAMRPERLALIHGQREVVTRVSTSGEGWESKDVPQSVYIVKADEVELCFTADPSLAISSVRALARAMQMGFVDETLAQPRQITWDELQTEESHVEAPPRLFDLPAPAPDTRLEQTKSSVRVLGRDRIDPRYSPFLLPTLAAGVAALFFTVSGFWLPIGVMSWLGLWYSLAVRLPRVEDCLELRKDGLYVLQHGPSGPVWENVPVQRASRVEVAVLGAEGSQAWCLRLQVGENAMEVPMPLTRAEAEWFCKAVSA